MAKILLIDIETSPCLSYVWGHYEQNVLAVENYWYIMSFSAKWLDGSQVTKCISDYSTYKKSPEDDSLITKDIWKLLDEADIAIAHNGNAFDFKKINTRFLFNNLTPPSPYKTIDTLLIARRIFAFDSNKLDDLGDFLQLGRKADTGGFKLWQDCMSGDLKAWKLMKRYNAQDVKLLEKIYLELRAWDNHHPNLGIHTSEMVCPKCGSDDIQLRGFTMNSTTKYRRFQCNSCHGWGRSPIAEKLENKPLVNA